MNKSVKEKLKTITRKTTPMTFNERIQKLKETTQGWLGYFRMASIQGKLKELDGWVRNRLKYCIWHNWKKRTHAYVQPNSKNIRNSLKKYVLFSEMKQ